MNRKLAIKENLLSFLAVLLTVFSANAVPDDTEIFAPPPGNPKVLFVLDASHSMGRLDGGAVSRLDRLKAALTALLSDTSIEGVDIGMMRFSTPLPDEANTDEAELIFPVRDIVTNREAMIEVANSLRLGEGSNRGTPTTVALYESVLYLTGAAPHSGVTPDGAPEYQSPVVDECDSSHLVVLSDGAPTVHPEIVSFLESEPNNFSCELYEGNARGQCGHELVNDYHTRDQFPDLEGDQFITTYSIGFNVNNNWLVDLAARGGGLYREAASTQDLVEVFRDIINDVTQSDVASAPAVPVNSSNESRDGNELYYTLFQSSTMPRWAGNVKKYLLKDGILVVDPLTGAEDDAAFQAEGGTLQDGVIVDANDKPVIVNGFIEPSSQSLWSDAADGASVALGGMAALQPAVRKWYTDAGVTPDVDGEITPQLVTSPADISNASIGVADDADDEAEKIVLWALGTDSIDWDSDGDTTEASGYVGDSLHSSPVVVTYEVNADNDVNKQALFIGNNMGVLHAIDPQDGTELWSYTPEELLPNFKEYIDNDSANHIYGLDGQAVLDATRTETADGTVVTDKAWLYLSQRRGGNSIFALDVTNALDNTDPFKVMWKIKGGEAGTDFRNLGQTWSTPQLITIKQGCPANCTDREVLMFSGGYNPAVYDDTDLNFPVTVPNNSVGHGNAVYMVDPATGELLWSAGKGGHHSLNLPMNDSVPETPVPVDNNADGAIDILFFSDIGGHVWRIDLDAGAQTGNNLSDLAIDGGMIAELNEPGQSLRFFNRPDVVLNGTTLGLSSFSIVLGSGMRSGPLFIEPDNNRVFAINDPWPFTRPPEKENGPAGELEYRYAVSPAGDRSVITTARLTEFGETYSNPDGGPLGFYRELEPGEKILEESLTHAGRIFLASYAPTANNGHCDPAIGESRLYVFDLLNGDSLLPDFFGDPYFVLSSGIAPPIDIVDTGGAGGPVIIVGTEAISLHDLLQPDVPNAFRRFVRTGWIELDD